MFSVPSIGKRISLKVMIGLVVLALVMLLSSGLAVVTFDHFRKGYEVVRQEKIPGLIFASKLIRESEQLVAHAPDIMVARNRYIRSSLAHGIAARAKAKDELMANLERAGIDKGLLEALSRRFDSLFANLKELIELANSLDEMETRTRQINLRLHRISENASSLVTAPSRDGGFSGAFAPVLRPPGHMDSTVLRYKEYVNWLGSLNRSIAELLSLQSLENVALIKVIETRFTSHMGGMALPEYSSFPGMNKKMRSIEEEIRKYGTGEESLFHHRRRQIALDLKIEGNLVDNKFLSQRLVETVDGIFNLIQKDIAAQSLRFDRQIKGFTNLLIITLIVGLLSAVIIFLYVRSSVVGRILSLKKYMEGNVTGRTRGVPIQGSDEISDMVRSVNFFIAEIEKREQHLENAVVEMERARDAAEAANRTKSVFLANMSHELRTPLNAILGFSRLLSRDRNLDSSQRKNLATITGSGEHLLMVINDVLAMSKIEAGRTVLSERNFDLHHLLTEIEEMFRLRVREKGLRLVHEIDQDVPRYVRADEIKLRQVLINLLNNALKFTSEGGIFLRVEAESSDPLPGEKHSIRFEVEDTGMGIREKELEKIFEAFAQSDLLQGEEEGTGLGLPISRRFVELMGGSLRVRSRWEEGSVFWFHIHVAVTAQADRRARERSLKVTGLAPDQPHYRLMVVDDNRENRRLLTAMLAPLGFDLYEAANGKQAVGLFKKHKPHLVFMDIRMPVMDGRKATRSIRSLAGGQNTVVIAVTASVFEEEREEVISSGCDDFLRKPFLESDIFHMLEKHLALRFIYNEAEKAGEETGVDEMERKEGEIDPAALCRLPEELLKSLEKAAKRAEMDLVAKLIEEVRKHDALLARGVEGLADDFSYEKIVDLIRRSRVPGGG